MDMPTIMEILRHTQISQTVRYVKGGSTLLRDAMRRGGGAFLSPQKGPPETRDSGIRRATAAPRDVNEKAQVRRI
uniref:hypothetical protein n=1 Tax=Streptomyces thermolilacinus TaxID=285540 RepID=UPI000400A623